MTSRYTIRTRNPNRLVQSDWLNTQREQPNRNHDRLPAHLRILKLGEHLLFPEGACHPWTQSLWDRHTAHGHTTLSPNLDTGSYVPCIVTSDGASGHGDRSAGALKSSAEAHDRTLGSSDRSDTQTCRIGHGWSGGALYVVSAWNLGLLLRAGHTTRVRRIQGEEGGLCLIDILFVWPQQ